MVSPDIIQTTDRSTHPKWKALLDESAGEGK